MDKQELVSKIGQMLVVGFPGKILSDDVKKLIHDYRVGNFILFSRNIGTPDEVQELTASLQLEAEKAGHFAPLLISIDQENGIVSRLKYPATAFPGAMSLGAIHDSSTAKQIGYATGLELKELGVNWNLAPDVDVNNNPNNPVINVRSFGEDPGQVAELGSSWMKGIQMAGVATTMKHFPGHGDTNVDSHLDLPRIDHSFSRLKKVELVPFIEGIRNNVDCIMSAHIYFSSLEKRVGRPATLSNNILTGLLRETLGFEGVITTDCLEMNAIKSKFGVASGAVEAIQAGADIAMISHTYQYQVEAIKGLLNAIKEEKISIEHLEQSVRRVFKLKHKYTYSEKGKEMKGKFKYIGSLEHQELADRTYKRSVSNMIQTTKLKILDRDSKVLAIYQKQKGHSQVEDRESLSTITSSLRKYPANIDGYEVDFSTMDNIDSYLEDKSKDYDDIIIFMAYLQPDDRYLNMIKPLVSQPNSTVISLRGPFSLKQLGSIDNAICVYDDNVSAICSALDVVYGKNQATGLVPISV
ncbi:beta-N-acetylhexosaminidase [Pullulanibacillus pueri]|uniref:Beta-glucosidase n=1 Tax=Pullulanibacillus pueri TaxID=1437324 RepID=A0A8J2ZTE5_9BACL|nr:glycoside hydrolase family 3 protein [Pullulanibacillus pueri]MBM7681845.1 beta-N-acetylhexosaminidase [Pullulanibacillus pueri]GGH76316.1 beta-glucosidase [Pullulanibacillus pueri]